MSSITTSKTKRSAIDAGLPTTEEIGPPPKKGKIDANSYEELKSLIEEQKKQLEERDKRLEEEKKRAEEVKKNLELQLEEEKKRLEEETKRADEATRQLSALSTHPPSDAPKKKVVDLTPLESAFQADYIERNKTVEMLKQHVHCCVAQFNGDDIYSPYLTLVQSSGTGKSRLLAELAKRHFFSVYWCLRKHSTSSGFPYQSKLPAKFFLDKELVGTFETKCYLEILDKLKRTEKVEDGGTAIVPAMILFLLHCIYLADAAVHPLLPPHTSASSSSSSSCPGYFEQVFNNQINTSWNVTMTAADYFEEFDQYVAVLKKIATNYPSSSSSSSSSTDKPIILLCVDEARTLLETSPDTNSISFFRLLRRALKRLSKMSLPVNIVAIFTDTISNISVCRNSGDVRRSPRQYGVIVERERVGGLLLSVSQAQMMFATANNVL